MSKFSLIVVVLGIAVSFIVLVILIFLRTTSTPPPTITPTPTTTTQQTPPIPTSETIESAGIEINNPFTNASDYTPQGDALTIETDTYSIVYLNNFDEFLITIHKDPFENNRLIAERAFINRLGITEEEACLLRVTITSPKKEDDLTPSYGLSFCTN